MPLNTKFFNPTAFEEEEIYTRRPDLGDTPITSSAASESAKGLRRGVANLRSGVLSQRAAFNELTGDVEERDELERRAEEASESARGFEARIGDYRDVKSVGDVIDYGVGGMFESLPFMAGAVAGGVAGRTVAKVAGAGVRAKNIATTAGAFTGLASPETGFTYEEIKEETGKRDPYRAFGAGATKAALDTFSLAKGIKGTMGKGGAKDILATGAREGVTESMQEGIDILTVRDAAGKELIAPLGGENTARLINAGLLGAAAGAGFSTAGKATKAAISKYRGKNPDKTLEEMLREGAMEEDGSVNAPNLGGKISFSKPDADEFAEGELSSEELYMEEFGELSGTVAFNDPDIVLNSKGMPWVSVDMYQASGVQNPSDALERQRATLNRQYANDSPLYASELEKLEREGGTEEQKQALLEEHSPYQKVSYKVLARRIAEEDGISLSQARDQIVRSIVASNPRFERILAETGPKYILDNLFYIEKAAEFKSEDVTGFSDVQLFGDTKVDADTRAKKAIIRKPKFTKAGYRYSGEVPVEITSKTGKRTNKTLNLPNLVKYSMYSNKRKEGQSLIDYVAESMYSGLAELQVSRLEANVSGLMGEVEKATKKAKKERVESILEPEGEKSGELSPQGLTQEEKESIVVYTEFRGGKTVNQITLAEVERTGTGRTKARISALGARRNRINTRARKLKAAMQEMEFQIAIYGMTDKAKELKNQWLKARDDFETLSVDLDRAYEEHSRALDEEAKRGRETQESKDIAMVLDPAEFETVAGESAVETGVPDAGKKQPVSRVPKKPWHPDVEGLNNFDMMEEKFEKHVADGDYVSAVDSFKSMIQGLEEAKELLLIFDPKSENQVARVKKVIQRIFPDAKPGVKVSKKALIKKINGKVWGLNQRIDMERARLSKVGEKPKKKKFDDAIKGMHRDLKDIYVGMATEIPKAFGDKLHADPTRKGIHSTLDEYKQERADTVSEVKKELSRAGLEEEVYALDIAELEKYGLGEYLSQVLSGHTFGFAGTTDAFKRNAMAEILTSMEQKVKAVEAIESMEAKGYKQMMFAMPIMTNKTAITNTIRHEVGHTILNHHKSKITGRVGEEIIAEYEAWRAKFKKEEGALFTRKLLEERTDELVLTLKEGRLFTTNGTHSSSQQFIDYMEDFEEWFADKAKERLSSPAKPVSLLDRFFEELVEAIRLFLSVSKGNYEGSATDFVDRMLSQHSDTNWEYARTAAETLVDVTSDVLLTVMVNETDHAEEARRKGTMFDQLDAYFKKTLGRGVGPAEIDKMLKMSGLGVTDAISAAFHNSMIEAMDTLYTAEEKNILMNAAKSPVVIRQLRKLLQPYPRAFEEAQADPEVAAAYMYQFWMTGHIKLGNKTKDNFYKAQSVLDDVVGIIHDQENAEHLLEEFVRGNVILSEQDGEKRYAIKQVVKDTMIKRVVHDQIIPMTDKLFGKGDAGGAIGSLFSAAQTRIMDTNNAWIKQLGNMISPQVGQEGVGEGMIPARNRRTAEYTNVIHDIFDGKSTEHGIEVATLLNSGRVVKNPKTEVEKDADRVRKEVMEPMHKYLKGAGLDVGKVKNYFPWVFDIEYLTNNKHALINLLNEKEFDKPMHSIAVSMTAEGYTWEGKPTKQEVKDGADPIMPNDVAAEILAKGIIESGGYADVEHVVAGTGISRSNPQMSAINKRKLKFIFDYGTQAQKDKFGAFMSKNLGLTLITYIDQGVKRAEYNRRFGKLKEGQERIVFADVVPEDMPAKKRDEVMEMLAGPDYKLREEAFLKEWNAAVNAPIDVRVPTEEEYGLAINIESKLERIYFKAVRTGATVQELELMSKYMDAVMGTSGADINRKLSAALGLSAPPPGELINPKLQRAMGVAMVYQNVRLLAMSAITSIADPIGIAVRTGDIGIAFSSMGVGIREVFKSAKGDKSTLVSLSEMLGTIDLEMTVDALNWEYGGVFMVGPEKRLNEAFFKWNGLQALTRATRIMATEAGMRFLKKHINHPDKNSARYLSELNLNASEVNFDKEGNIQVLSVQERTGLHAIMSSNTATAKQKNDARADFMADEHLRTAINRFVDTSILRPDATLRPIWASDPHFMLVFHLKSFMYAFSERILMRVYIEAQNSNTAPLIMLALFIPAMLAADALRDLIQFGTGGNPRKQDWGWADYTGNAINRAGLYGLGQIGDDILKDIKYGGVGLNPIIGPTLEQAGQIMHAAASDTQDYDMIKALPAQNVYKNWEF